MAYPNNLSTILQLMGYKLDIDFYAKDNLDGNGPLITQWKHEDPTPTESQINSFYTNYLNDSDRLLEKKAEAKIYVDIEAETARNRYLTIGSGQAMTYIRKEIDAQAYKDAGYPTIDETYPWINAEVEATGNTGQKCADDILAQATIWISIGTTIEKYRRQGKINIDAAINEEGVDIAKENAISLLEAI